MRLQLEEPSWGDWSDNLKKKKSTPTVQELFPSSPVRGKEEDKEDAVQEPSPGEGSDCQRAVNAVDEARVESQRQVFRCHVQLGLRFKRPLVLHLDGPVVINILKKELSEN